MLRTGDIFLGLDRIDDKITFCIKLAEETLICGRLGEQDESGFENPWASKEHNPRSNRQGRTTTRSQGGSPAEFSHKDIFLELSDVDRDQAFIDNLDELDGPISDDELIEWSDDIDLFMQGLSNPDKLKDLWEQSKAKMLWDESQSRFPS